jgi:hypothetical protein
MDCSLWGSLKRTTIARTTNASSRSTEAAALGSSVITPAYQCRRQVSCRIPCDRCPVDVPRVQTPQLVLPVSGQFVLNPTPQSNLQSRPLYCLTRALICELGTAVASCLRYWPRLLTSLGILAEVILVALVAQDLLHRRMQCDTTRLPFPWIKISTPVNLESSILRVTTMMPGTNAMAFA